MKQFFSLLLITWLSAFNSYGQIRSQEVVDNQISFSIDADFSPETLHELMQLLKKAGISLELSQTGYCNGYLRILKGQITGTDGRSIGFETNALRRLTVILELHKKELGVQRVQLKKRWRKCHENGKLSEENEGAVRQSIINIHFKENISGQKPAAQ